MVAVAGVSDELEQAAASKATKTRMEASILGPELGLGWAMDLMALANRAYMWRQASRSALLR
jgi:hypothetical protein